MPNILITGGSGLIGQHLTKLLISKGYQVAYLTRKINAQTQGIKQFIWDVNKGEIDGEAIHWADSIIHLAGESVGQRWTKKVQRKILNSRVDSTRLLVDQLKANNHKVKAFVSASAVGYYGADTKNEILTETSAPGKDFLADIAINWEKAADQAKAYTDRIVKIRIGIVLADGGALAKMAAPIKLGAGSALGSGNQWMSWIHIDDLCNMFLYAIENPVKGVFNGVGPRPATNNEFTKILAKQLKRPLFMPNVPSFVLKLLLGKMAGLVLGGNKAMPTAFLNENYTFKYEELSEALKSLV
ncbi:MAG: TIGR01777 family protein [Bacteroidetes bacterium]|nr:MAG: TIGR01777 family protein [Bacteroidota bacterium]